jgi:tripartite-type tricarboxylate transporter receptor subunit TctC
MLKRITKRSIVILAGWIYSVTAYAQYPDKAIRLVVPAPAGAFADIVAREFGDRLSKSLGQPVVIDNKGGASGGIAYAAAARSAPDGYTVLITNTGPSAINPELFRAQGLSYDPINDFEPITIVCLTPVTLVVKADSPFKTVADLIGFARNNAGKLSFGTTGAGQLNHLSAEYLNSLAGIKTLHVPYTSGPAVLTDVLAGRVDYMFYPPASAKSFIADGRMRALAVTSGKRTVALPDVPTLAESGYPVFDLSAWFGLAVPKGTSQPVIDALGKVSRQIAADPGYAEKLRQQGIDHVAWMQKMTHEEMRRFHQNELDRWTAIVKLSGAANAAK